jgi:hypothetical protein
MAGGLLSGTVLRPNHWPIYQRGPARAERRSQRLRLRQRQPDEPCGSDRPVRLERRPAGLEPLLRWIGVSVEHIIRFDQLG